MHQSQPSKITCKHCGGSHCFEEETAGSDGSEVTSYMCIDCGYTTTTLNVEGSEVIQYYEETTAQLIKDLRWVDDTNLVWYPLVLNFPSVGIIFPDGHNKEDWWWTTAPAVDVSEEEKAKYPVPGTQGQYYKRRVDMNQRKSFPKNQFREASKHVGFIISEDLA
jgi:hypothetical protein